MAIGSEQGSFISRADENRDCERIAELNDELRRTGVGGFILVTKGVKAIVGYDPDALLQVLIHYDDFGRDNDPYGERDFGTIEHAAQKLFWQINYYDNDWKYASPDPSNAVLTERVLTIMLASEY